MRQAFAMLKAIASLHTYRHLTLDHSFYVMTLLASVGYFAVIAGGALLDRLGEAARGRTETATSRLQTVLGNLLTTLTNERWVWITPLVIVMALYLSVVFHPGPAETGPVMYALF
jgi:hypothetical protein